MSTPTLLFWNSLGHFNSSALALFAAVATCGVVSGLISALWIRGRYWEVYAAAYALVAGTYLYVVGFPLVRAGQGLLLVLLAAKTALFLFLGYSAGFFLGTKIQNYRRTTR